MITKTGLFTCDQCGKYIAFTDIERGIASHKMITPDSHLSSEDYETLCSRCKSSPSDLSFMDNPGKETIS